MKLNALPQIIINYKKLKGKDALDLTNELNQLPDLILTKFDIILAMEIEDIMGLPDNNKFNIFIQDIFADELNCFINYFKKKLVPATNKISGVIINHPEKQLSDRQILANLEVANKLNLKTLLCAVNVNDAIKMSKYSPSYIGLENKDLIGKDESFVNHCPQIVEEVKTKVDKDILIGAGVRTSTDLKHVINSGGAGVIISSLICKSMHPLDTLNNFLNIF